VTARAAQCLPIQSPPSMELTWNFVVSMWNRSIASATRWTRTRLIFGVMVSG